MGLGTGTGLDILEEEKSLPRFKVLPVGGHYTECAVIAGVLSVGAVSGTVLSELGAEDAFNDLCLRITQPRCSRE